MNSPNFYPELNLESLERCAQRWGLSNDLIESITLYRGMETPYVLVVLASHPDPRDSDFQTAAHPDLVDLRRVWDDPECLQLQDDFLEISLNDFNCSAKIGVFLGKWRCQLQWNDTVIPNELVRVETAVIPYNRAARQALG